jgi:hypothetical protein
MRRFRKALLSSVLVALLLQTSGCVFLVRTVEPVAVSTTTPPGMVTSPLKVFLNDGRIALFRNGAIIDTQFVTGTGEVFSLTPSVGEPVARIPVSEVHAIEGFRERFSVPRSVLMSAGVSAVLLFFGPRTLGLPDPFEGET